MKEYEHCLLCPRKCGTDRTIRAGFCGMTYRCTVAKAMVHMWEEPCISGVRGSGAVFFSGCNLRCVFCQNAVISHDGFGEAVSAERLARIFKALETRMVHNLNLVTATPFIPTVKEALLACAPKIPVVWNSGGYEDAETIKSLEGYVQIYLPDLKHKSSRLSKLCTGAEDYFLQASRALSEMKRQVGENIYDENGILQRGMIIRHLLLPGCTRDARDILDYIAEHFPGTPVSLMRQYTPSPRCSIPGLDRRVTDKEYESVAEHMQALHIPGFLQDADSAQNTYTPSFDLNGLTE